MTDEFSPPVHGGDPQSLIRYPSAPPLLDLSAAINPWSWPVPPDVLSGLARLPYASGELLAAASDYYQVHRNHILPTPGSQAAIQAVPHCVPAGRVLLAGPCYEEHAYRWRLAGHQCHFFTHDQHRQVPALIQEHDINYLILVSPNNPTGEVYSADLVGMWRGMLPDDGLVVVDQAYADVQKESLCTSLLNQPGVVLIRSVGKFFGLPGLRLGFVLGEATLLEQIGRFLGPWSVSSIAQDAGALMLRDTDWQRGILARLEAASLRQARMLKYRLEGYYSSWCNAPLFITFELSRDSALALHQLALHHGIAVRVYTWADRGFVRWGITANETELELRLDGLGHSLSQVEPLD